MVLDLDLRAFCDNLKATKPPYECPVPHCRKVYKSYSGIQFHLYHFDHSNPDLQAVTPQKRPASRKARGRWHHRANRRSPTPPEFFRDPVPDTLTYSESQRLVEVDVDGRLYRINIYEPLEIITQDEIDNCDNTEKEAKPDKSPPPKSGKETPKVRKDTGGTAAGATVAARLPEASFRIIEDFVKPVEVPTRPQSYYRFIEKSVDELDDEVEYDMDEEDYAWLDLVNKQRAAESLSPMSHEVFEVLMDRFEKEAFFQSQSSGKDLGPSIDEDAVCSICMDGECQNSNVILFCDMCNLAVHQECYGVPYIPEGQWLCRRCLQSPSCAVDCCLCPNKGGAFKQTDDGRWAHVVCALWIPEVGFANTVFLEPIDSIEHIPAARWKLSCYICKQRGTGACIQCHKTNCYTAFHVTCAQQAALFMKIEPIRETSVSGTSVSVRKTAYCDVHTPPDSEFATATTPSPAVHNGGLSDDADRTPLTPAEAKAKSRIKMRKARKILAEKRKAMPIVSIPVIPQTRLAKIVDKVAMTKKNPFIERLQSYWALKRQSRNGVPLLRRLQTNHMSNNREQVCMAAASSPESSTMRRQLLYWQRLRQDLEKARLLVELIRKREKLKKEYLRLHQQATKISLQPFAFLLLSTLQQLEDRDVGKIYMQPVDLDEVPDYTSYVKHPMDFSTMRTKVTDHVYKSMSEFETDFSLIISNCLTYNSKDTVFYRSAIRLRDQGGTIIRASTRLAEKAGYDHETGLHAPEPPLSAEEKTVLDDAGLLTPEGRSRLSLEDQLRVLLDKHDTASSKRCKRSRALKQMRKEISNIRRQLSMQKPTAASSSTEQPATPHSSPVASPTRQASPKKSVTPKKACEAAEETPSAAAPAKTRAKPGRPRRQKVDTESEPAPDTAPETSSKDDVEVAAAAAAGDKEDDTGHKGDESVSPPTGVNRRTAVLLTKKVSSKGASSRAGTGRKGPGRPPKPRGPCGGPQLDDEDDDDEPAAAMSPPRKRSASLAGLDGTPPASATAKRHLSDSSPAGPAVAFADGALNRGSFTQYRGRSHVISDLDTTSDSGSQSETDSSPRSSSDSDDDDGHRYSRRGAPGRPTVKRGAARRRTVLQIITEENELEYLEGLRGSTTDACSQSDDSCRQQRGSSDINTDDDSAVLRRSGRKARSKPLSNDWSSGEDDDVIPLEPLDLVWAKCRGYPWYPALIINPKMPKTGYFHNGVPIPVPPEDVLELQRKYEEPVYLVLFFDTKRTWQWLPRTKLEPLGVDSGLDKVKQLENKKPNVRKAVRKAYEKAILHRCKVTGEPNPLSSESEPDV